MSHNRSQEILGPTFRWEDQTSEDKAEAFQSCLHNPDQLQSGWERWRGQAQHDIMDWNPGMFLPGSEHLRLYCTYYPIIIDRGNARKLVCFNSNRILQSSPIESRAPREWMNMPDLDFLPPGVDDVIAGAAGLLIVNGGLQPRARNLGHTRARAEPDPAASPSPVEEPNEEVGIEEPLEDFPAQSILVACNPLQRDFHILPCHSKYKMHHKTARMVLVDELQEIGDWGKPRPNTGLPAYKLYLIGSEVIESGSLDPNSSEVSLFSYDSRVDAWVACSSLRDARLPPHGRTDIAIVGDGLYFGGQARTETAQSVRRRGGKAESVWENKIFFIEISSSRWNQISFAIPDFANPGATLDCQAPRVLQCEVNGMVYIATRPLEKPNTIQIWELEIYSKLPTRRLNFVTALPHEYFYALFGRIESHKAWDCSAGRNYLAFVPAYDEQLPEVCMYKIDKGEWNFSRLPLQHGKMAKYRLARAEWVPHFPAPRTIARDRRKECACIHRLNPLI